MQVVGFGVDYAIFRNSYGVGWGEEGYARVYFDYSDCYNWRDYYYVPDAGY